MRWPTRNPAVSTNTSKVCLTTSYEGAADVWDRRIGTARVQAHNWRLAALIALFIALMSVAGLLYVTMHRPLKLHVLEIDRHGKPGRIVLAEAAYTPDVAQIGYQVAQLVELVRERPLDPVVLRQNWEEAYHFLAGDAVVAMNEYARQHSGLEIPTSLSSGSGGRLVTRTVEITSVLPRTEHSYQVHWIETQYSGGVVDLREPYTGIFHVALDPPRDEAELFRNPLGLYVVHFEWTRDFTPTPPREGSAAAQHLNRPTHNEAGSGPLKPSRTDANPRSDR